MAARPEDLPWPWQVIALIGHGHGKCPLALAVTMANQHGISNCHGSSARGLAMAMANPPEDLPWPWQILLGPPMAVANPAPPLRICHGHGACPWELDIARQQW